MDDLHRNLVEEVSKLPEDKQRDAVRHIVMASVREVTYALNNEYRLDDHLILEETRAACKDISEFLYCSCHPRDGVSG